jgi:hypothetical protein
VRALDRVLTYASGREDVWFARKDEIAVHQESLTAMRQEVETAIAGINEPWRRLDEAIVAHCRILLGGSVTRAILTPPRYYNLKGVRKLVRQRDEYEHIFGIPGSRG